MVESTIKFNAKAEKIDAPEVDYSDKLVWKPLIFNDQQTGYTVSSFGSVKDKDDKLCKFHDFKDHYTFDFKINGETKRLKIHRLVALAFIENPNNFNFIQHVDGNPFNNRVDNLKWVSSARCSIPIEIKNKDLIEANSTDANWRPVYVNGEQTNYNVSNEGQIQVADTLKLRALSTRTGYATFTLIHKDERMTKQVHRLVAEAFIPNDDVKKKYVNHINYNKLDNRVENLEWMTASENNKHAHQNEDRKSTRIPVIRTNLDGTEPFRYEYVNLACRDFGSDINHCLAGRREQVGGYRWTYENVEYNKIGDDDIDLDEFKPIEGHPNFLISRDARIYNSTRKQFLTPRKTGVYMGVVLDKEPLCIHRLIATHFIDKPENYDDNWIVNHKDGDKLNNGIENLEWMSASDNTRHMYETGTRKDARPILQKDLAGNIIKEYLNAGHVSRELDRGRPINGQILRACKDPNKSVIYGYQWQFKV